MVYRVLGLMSGSSLDGVDLACVDFQQVSGRWTFQVHATACVPYDATWRTRLQSATSLAARDYQLLHVSYGHYLGELVNQFLTQHQLHYQVQLIAVHGHTTFHMPGFRMTHQLGDGAALAASTGINTVTDLRAMDVALGGQGAPIVPIGEKLLWPDYSCFLNLGGICNLTVMTAAGPLAFDVCPANKVLNLLAQLAGMEFDRNGELSRTGRVHPELLQQLDQFPYYQQTGPKSLSNDFGIQEIFPLLKKSGLTVPDALRTYCQHIVNQLYASLAKLLRSTDPNLEPPKLLVTGGGAKHQLLLELLQEKLSPLPVQLMIPDTTIVDFKEAMVMAFIGVLRWRQENTVLASVTGATRDSIGGSVWMGADG